MTSITTWQRIEPRARSADPAPSLQMRIEDPLWLLGRQWQFGEFAGEDAGSPVWATWSAEGSPMELYLPGPLEDHVEADVQICPADQPLESYVEREVRGAAAVFASRRRLAVEGGQHFLRLLPPKLATRARTLLAEPCGLQRLKGAAREGVDPESLSFLDLMAGRALDGSRLLAQVDGLPPKAAARALGFEAADRADAARALEAWLAWCARSVGSVEPAVSPAPRSAWDPARMEHSFAIAGPLDGGDKQVVLKAREYKGSGHDWYDVDRVPTPLARKTLGRPETHDGAALPTGMSFRGMPSRRLWEFEDAQVSLAGMTAAATDLTRLLFVEFMLQYGNDFYVVPVELLYGRTYRVNGLEVLDTFGGKTRSQPFADTDWRMFDVSPLPSDGPCLYLPQVTGGQRLGGAPLEVLQLRRDETANLCWAIEQQVESPSGRPIHRNEEEQARRQALPPATVPAQRAAWSYHLSTAGLTFPSYWFALSLDQQQMGRLHMNGVAEPAGALLQPLVGDAALLHDEEIPRSGALVRRAPLYARWLGGELCTWIGREKRSGRGEASSGLTFDVVQAVLKPE